MKKISKAVTATLFLLSFGIVRAQNKEENEVKAPIQQLFEGMKKSDSALVRQAFAEGGRLETVVKDKAGVMSVKTEDLKKILCHHWLADCGRVGRAIVGNGNKN